MKLWRYNNLESDNKTVLIQHEYKEPFIWSLTAPDSDYLEASTEETQKQAIALEVIKIEDRKKDGILAYEEALAGMRLGRLANSTPHETYRLNVYLPMNDVISSVSLGSWIDAYEFLNTVVSNPYLSESTITGFRLKIANYIVNSGNYSEYANNTVDSNGYII